MAKSAHDKLKGLITKRLGQTKALPEIAAIAKAARTQHGQSCVAVLAYGSCLRGVSTNDSLVDLYVLVSDYTTTHTNPLTRWLNQLIPPNVYYLEHPYKKTKLRAKYAIVSLSQFAKRCSAETENPYFWARFAQPSALVWAKDKATKDAIIEALTQSTQSLLQKTAPLCPAFTSAQELWETALGQTYQTELRSEAQTRARDIVKADMPYYNQAAKTLYGANLQHLHAEISDPVKAAVNAKRQWASRRWQGKWFSILRLSKASFTFQGGADYIAWKIARHSGVKIEVTDWQRRHPILAGLILLPKLLVSGAIR